MNKLRNFVSLEFILLSLYALGAIYFSLLNFNLMALSLSLFCILGTVTLKFLLKKNLFRERMLYFTLQIFLFFSSFLGSSFNFYRIPNYDDFLHIWSGFICTSIAWNVLLYFNKKINFSKYFIAIFLFMFSMGTASIWEITEYLMDTFLGTTCQQGLIDTNIDMIDCLIGSIIMCSYYFKKMIKEYN